MNLRKFVVLLGSFLISGAIMVVQSLQSAGSHLNSGEVVEHESIRMTPTGKQGTKMQSISTASAGNDKTYGVIEGFYGSPWTTEERIHMFEFMEKNHLNTYVYAPKDDPLVRSDWSQLYRGQSLSNMEALVHAADNNHIRFVCSVSPGIPAPLPGQTITTQDIERSITYSSASDEKRIEEKFDQLRAIGVHTFLLSFDDVQKQLKPVDAKVYGNDYALAQISLANRIFQVEHKKDGQFQLWFAPTIYYGLTDNSYWSDIRQHLNVNIPVIWTGKWVINSSITTAEAEEVEKWLGRKPLLWDNYPVNDYTYAQNHKPELLMGPLENRSADLLTHVSGYVANPMLQPEASKIALTTLAEYLQNPRGYQPMSAWHTAISDVSGVQNSAPLTLFCTYASESALEPNGNTPIPTLSKEYFSGASKSSVSAAGNQLQTELTRIATLPKTLPASVQNAELLSEIQPWLKKLGQEGQLGLEALFYRRHPSTVLYNRLLATYQSLLQNPITIGAPILDFVREVLQS